MTSLSCTLRAFSSRTGLRRTLVAYALYDMVEFAIWLAIILFAYDAGGAPLAAVVAVVQLLPAVVASPVLAASGTGKAAGSPGEGTGWEAIPARRLAAFRSLAGIRALVRVADIPS